MVVWGVSSVNMRKQDARVGCPCQQRNKLGDKTNGGVLRRRPRELNREAFEGKVLFTQA